MSKARLKLHMDKGYGLKKFDDLLKRSFFPKRTGNEAKKSKIEAEKSGKCSDLKSLRKNIKPLLSLKVENPNLEVVYSLK